MGVTRVALQAALTQLGANALFADSNGLLVAHAGVKVGQFTRDLSLASGNQSVAGVGFKPVAVIFISAVDSVVGQASWGFFDASTGNGITDHGAVVADQYQISGAINIQTGTGNSYSGALSSFDADGFTIAWTKAGSPTGTAYINYLAFR